MSPTKPRPPSLREQFAVVRKLIDERHFDEAVAVLRTIDHPSAREWEQRVRQQEARRDRLTHGLLQAAVIALVALVLALGGVVLLTVGQTGTQGQAAIDALSTWSVAQTAIARYAATESGARLTVQAARLPNAGDTAATLGAGGGTATAVFEAAQRTLDAEEAARLGGLERPLPAGSRIEYEMGFLRALTVESPTSFVLYRAAENGAALVRPPAGWRFVGVEIEFTCRPTAQRCDSPPEAALELAALGENATDVISLAGGDPALLAREASVVSAEPLVGGGVARGWRFFLMPDGVEPALLRLTTAQLPDGVYAALPPAVDGYAVETAWTTEPDGTRQRRLPAFRRVLEERGYLLDEVYLRQPPGGVSSVVFSVPLAAAALTETSALDAGREIALAAVGAWSGVRDLAPGGISIRLYNDEASLDLGSIGIAGSDLLAYLGGALDGGAFIERWLIIT